MRMIIRYFRLLPANLFFLLGLPACKTAGTIAGTTVEIVIPQANLQVEIDGIVRDEEWERTKKIGSFVSPWSGDKKDRGTEFFAFADTGYFYFAYRVKDATMLFPPYREETDVARGDRVEIFFAGHRDLKEYYCLEIDPRSHVLDYKASYYRNFDHSWDCPGLFVRGSESERGYTVEGRIPLNAFRKMGLIGPEKGQLCFYGGLYRADFRDNPGGEPFEEWISWINPETKEPDFHIPTSFGKFCLGLQKDH